MNGGHQEINKTRDIVHSGQLAGCSEAQLRRMIEVIDHYDASCQFDMTQGLRTPVQSQLERVQQTRYKTESKSESNRIHQEQMAEQARLHGIQLENDKRLATEAAADNNKKHAQTARTAKTANIIAGTALAVSIVAVIVGHHDSTPASIAGTNAIPIKRLQPLSEKPQTVSPTPSPTPTNLIQTNAAQKK
jgi:hypothetical protein